MKWSKWPYWLRGGVVATMITVLAIPIFLWFVGALFCSDDLICTRNIGFVKAIRDLTIHPSSLLMILVLRILPASAFGIFLGWLYEKIRGKSKIKDQISKN